MSDEVVEALDIHLQGWSVKRAVFAPFVRGLPRSVLHEIVRPDVRLREVALPSFRELEDSVRQGEARRFWAYWLMRPVFSPSRLRAAAMRTHDR